MINHVVEELNKFLAALSGAAENGRIYLSCNDRATKFGDHRLRGARED